MQNQQKASIKGSHFPFPSQRIPPYSFHQRFNVLPYLVLCFGSEKEKARR